MEMFSLPGRAAVAQVMVLVVLTSVAYFPALRGGFILDDDQYLTRTPLIKAPDGLYRYWFTSQAMDYYPVSNSTLWIEWRLWGMNSSGYHLTNLVLHITGALLVWRILQGLSVPGAFLAALLFAVHPVNVEAVAWIAQRKDMLATVLSLLSLGCFVRNEESRGTTEETQNGSAKAEARRGALWGIWYWSSLAAFVLAMLSKGSVATLPLVLLGVIIWRRRLDRWDVLRLAPYFAVAVVLTLVNISTQHVREVIREATFAERIAGAGAAVWFYLGKALCPIRLIFIYPQWQIRAADVLWWLPVAAAALVTCLLVWQSHWGRSKWARALLVSWLFFGVALAPMLGFTDVGFMQYSLVADHYQHLAMIGAAALAAAAWSYWHARLRDLSRWATNIVALAVVGSLAALTFNQSRLYANARTLYWATLEKNPDSWLLHYNLGNALLATGSAEQAVNQYQEAIRIKNDYIQARNNLGIALHHLGRNEEAIACFQEALKIGPGREDTYFNLGNLFSELDRPREAVEQYRHALQLEPDYAEAWANLAASYGDLNQWDEAMAAANNALKLRDRKD